MDLRHVRMSAPYPKRNGSEPLRRLCREAWSPVFDPDLGDETRDAIRAEAFAAAVSAASEEDLEVLRRYRATCMVDAYCIGVTDAGSPERSNVSGRFGCEIEVPSVFAKGTTLRLISSDSPVGSSEGGTDQPRVGAWIGDLIRSRSAGWAGYVAENDVITSVNRDVGTMSWRNLLQMMPHTRAHLDAVIGSMREGDIQA